MTPDHTDSLERYYTDSEYLRDEVQQTITAKVLSRWLFVVQRPPHTDAVAMSAKST